MTVVTLEQIEVACPNAFGKGSPPLECDLCDAPWTDERTPIPISYGPWTVFLCWPCTVKKAKKDKR
jgi:hypothetical protein